MKKTNLFITGAFALSMFAGSAMAADTIDADDFVEDASAAGIAEIETSKVALEKSTAADVKAFAQAMINDHTAANRELGTIASKKKLKVSTEAELVAKAKKAVLKQRDGESFNAAYASNQVAAHKATIELFKKASVSPDAELASFAVATLPKLEHHLHDAEALAKTYPK